MSCGAKVDASPPAPRGLTGPHIVLLVIGIVVAVFVGVGVIAAAGFLLFIRQPPAGPTTTLVYEADAGATAAELEAARAVIERRLELAGAQRGSAHVDGRQVRVSFAAEDPTGVDSFLRARGLLEFVPVAEDAASDDYYFEASSRANAEVLAAKLATPPGTPAYGKIDEGRWRIWFLDRTDLLSAPEIEDAQPVLQEDFGTWEIRLRLSREAGEAFEAFSTRHVEERVAIVLDGEVLMAPVVREPISGGKLSITLGSGDSTDQKRSTEDLCRLLRAGALPVELHLVSRGN
jgi:preprotein translocase subunit SecD